MDKAKVGEILDCIDLANAYHISQWTEIFDCTPAQLSDAVRAVGTKSSNVKRYLRECWSK
jgi:Protein of unknown function (DUF3606)